MGKSESFLDKRKKRTYYGEAFYFLCNMTIYAVKRKNETDEKLLARFKKQFQHSRFLHKARSCVFHVKAATKRYTRKAALIRESHRTKRKKESFY